MTSTAVTQKYAPGLQHVVMLLCGRKIVAPHEMFIVKVSKLLWVAGIRRQTHVPGVIKNTFLSISAGTPSEQHIQDKEFPSHAATPS